MSMSGGINLSKAQIGIVNLDKEEYPEGFVKVNFLEILFNDFLLSTEVKEVIDFTEFRLEEGEKLLKEGKLTALVIIPEDFTKNASHSFFGTSEPPVQFKIIKNSNSTLKAQIVEEYFKGFANTLSTSAIGKSVLVETMGQLGLEDKISQEVGSFMALISQGHGGSIRIAPRTVDKMKVVSGMQYYAAAMAMMFVLYTATYGARYMTKERFDFTYQRMLAANVTKWHILAGRFVTTALIVVIQLTVLVLMSKVMFKVYWGSLGAIIILMAMVAVTIASLAVLLSAINLYFNDYKVSNAFEGIGIQLFTLLAGGFVPMDSAPLLKKLGSFTPNGAAMEAVLKLMQGYGMSSIYPSIITLIIMILIFSLGGIFILAREGEA